jgi:hypothetical protein
MALGSTQPPPQMSTRNLPGDKGRPEHKIDSFTVICEPIVKKMWEPGRLTTLWASTACYRDSFTFNSRDSVVGTATDYGLDDGGVGVRVPVGSRIFSSPRRPDRLWDPPSLLSNGYWMLFPRW